MRGSNPPAPQGCKPMPPPNPPAPYRLVRDAFSRSFRLCFCQAVLKDECRCRPLAAAVRKREA